MLKNNVNIFIADVIVSRAFLACDDIQSITIIYKTSIIFQLLLDVLRKFEADFIFLPYILTAKPT